MWKCWSLSCVQLFVTPWTVAHQAPLSMGFSRQESPSPRDLPDPGTEPKSLMSPSLAGGFFTTSATWVAHEDSKGVEKAEWPKILELKQQQWFLWAFFLPHICQTQSWRRQKTRNGKMHEQKMKICSLRKICSPYPKEWKNGNREHSYIINILPQKYEKSCPPPHPHQQRPSGDPGCLSLWGCNEIPNIQARMESERVK